MPPPRRHTRLPRRHTRLLAIAVTLAGVLSPLTDVDAASMKERVEQAKKQYLAQEYEQAIRLLTPVVQSPIATISEKVSAYELLGLSYLILGDERRARAAFENLLGLDHGHMLDDPSGSPKLRRFFDSVKESFVPGYSARSTVTLDYAAPRRAIAGRKVEFAASIVRGRKRVGEVILRWRRAGLLTYRSRRMRDERQKLLARFILPEDTSSYRLEYYIEARSPEGHAVGRVGSPEAPLQIKVAGVRVRPSKPIYKQWWFWTVIGAAVVGGTAAGVIIGVSDDAPKGSLGDPVQLR